MKYKLSMFSFDLPEKLIADTPVKNRDDAKLMVLHKKTGEIEHKKVADLIDFGDDADGTFAPGGSMSIFMAMIMARDAFNLDITKLVYTSVIIIFRFFNKNLW